jgi:hypothetical protein
MTWRPRRGEHLAAAAAVRGEADRRHRGMRSWGIDWVPIPADAVRVGVAFGIQADG